jgi:hypothetical protein
MIKSKRQIKRQKAKISNVQTQMTNEKTKGKMTNGQIQMTMAHWKPATFGFISIRIPQSWGRQLDW